MAEPLWRLSAAVKAQPASAIPPTKGIKAIRLMTTTWPNQLFERNAQVMASPYPNGLGVVASSVAKLGLDHRSTAGRPFAIGELWRRLQPGRKLGHLTQRRDSFQSVK